MPVTDGLDGIDGIEGLATQAAALETSLAGAQAMTTAFDAELGRMRESMIFTGREVGTLSKSIGGGLRRASNRFRAPLPPPDHGRLPH